MNALAHDSACQHLMALIERDATVRMQLERIAYLEGEVTRLEARCAELRELLEIEHRKAVRE